VPREMGVELTKIAFPIMDAVRAGDWGAIFPGGTPKL
jgi:hypothetical protein